MAGDLIQTSLPWMTVAAAREAEAQPVAPIGMDLSRMADITVTVAFSRLRGRAKCQSCGIRRILYSLSVVGLVQGPAKCAKCMGLR